MKRSRCVFSVLLLVAAVGCADPTKDKPAAAVDAAKPAAAPTGDGISLAFTDASSIGFVGSKVTGSHNGGFSTFDGEIRLVGGDPEKSSVTVNIDTTSLWADDDRLTGHLKSPDFFDVENLPSASFRSTGIARDGAGYRITGNLELHGITKSISFPADIVMDGDRVTTRAEFSIKRFDFNIVYPGKAEDLIRDDVLIRLDLQAAPAGG